MKNIKIPIFFKLFFAINLFLLVFIILSYNLFIFLIEKEFGLFLLNNINEQKQKFIQSIESVIVEIDNQIKAYFLKNDFMLSITKDNDLIKEKVLKINKIINESYFVVSLNIFLNRRLLYFYAKSDTIKLPFPWPPEFIDEMRKNDFRNENDFIKRARKAIKDRFFSEYFNPLKQPTPPKLKKGFILENFTLRFNNRFYIINYIIYNEDGKKFLSRLKTYFVYIYIILVILSVPLIYLITKNFSNSIRKIAKQTIKLAGGDYDVNLNEKRNDELGLLIEEFNKLACKLKNEEEYLKSMIKSITHDITTPINIIKSYIYGIYDGVIKLDIKTLNEIDSEIERITELINEINKYSRNISYSNEIVENINITSEIEICIKKVQKYFENNSIFIEYDLGKDLYYKISKNHLRSLIENLLKNSIIHNNKLEKIVKIFLLEYQNKDKFNQIKQNLELSQLNKFIYSNGINYEEDKIKYVIIVNDNGNSFDEEKLKNIFLNNIKRIERDEKDFDKIHGYGLEIVKKICKVYNIVIEINYKKNIGTTFILYLK
ncbi:MAG: ATP-binding protein [Spirochaetes bacterium]|nr:ATP-binding protein [Spirochaetota bacterium]